MSGDGVTRRQLLRSAAAGLAVAGFDVVGRHWVSVADAAGCTGFLGAPRLDGTLLLDGASRAADRTDRGNMVFHTPAAVLRPGSVRDIQAMVRFCRDCRIPVAARGEHHTTFGQGLTDGLVVEMSALNTIHSIGPEGADVDAGVLWREIIHAAFAIGLRRPGLTGYTGLSVGGVLSVGGCPLSNDAGAVVDMVRELTVVTGAGDAVRCSATRNRDLFEAALGGLGQCGIIVRALVDLVPAKPMARTYLLHYLDANAFFKDFRTLVRRGELNDVYNVCMPPGSSLFLFEINATVFFDPAAPPDDAHLMRDLTLPAPLAIHLDLPYVAYTQFVDTQIAVLQLAGWDRLVKPWFDVWLPEPTVQPYVTDVLGRLTPQDIAPTGFILLFAQRRSRLTRPFFRLPDPTLGEWVYLFDILGASALPGPDPSYAQRMLARNRGWYEQARGAGGTRYPIGSLEFSHDDWAAHYGEQWPRFQQLKRRYDPGGILTPGPAIF
ncbi:MAG: FAD-binding protein [Solirubrobacteraceae bacterium]